MQKRKTLGELRELAPLLGKTRGAARQWLKESKVMSPQHPWVRLEVMRVVREDGVGQACTLVQCLEQVSVELTNDVVTKIVGVG